MTMTNDEIEAALDVLCSRIQTIENQLILKGIVDSDVLSEGFIKNMKEIKEYGLFRNKAKKGLG